MSFPLLALRLLVVFSKLLLPFILFLFLWSCLLCSKVYISNVQCLIFDNIHIQTDNESCTKPILNPSKLKKKKTKKSSGEWFYLHLSNTLRMRWTLRFIILLSSSLASIPILLQKLASDHKKKTSVTRDYLNQPVRSCFALTRFCNRLCQQESCVG